MTSTTPPASSENSAERSRPVPTVMQLRHVEREFAANQVWFGAKHVVRAVDGISLDIRTGETLAVVGESGCGKSTLARLLMRLIRPTSGQVLYNGRDIGALPKHEMRRLRKDIQFIFQDPFSSLNPRMTVGAIVEEPLRVHGIGNRTERHERVKALLRRVGLRAEHAGRYPHEFSGGQRQRIGIARALASGPKVLIGDEPVSALDVSVQAQVINLLEDLKAEFDLTLVLIAHDLAVIRHMADRVAVMYLGEIVELAVTESLYEQPLHPYTQALMRAIPIPLPGKGSIGAGLKGDVPSPLAPPSGCRFHTRCPHATPLCGTQKPLLETTDGDRFVACHHWKQIAEHMAAPDRELAHTKIAERRFALFRDWSEKQKTRQTQSSPEPSTPPEES